MNRVPSALGNVGRLFQIAYMAEDFDETLARWNAIGVGPFYAMRGVPLKDIDYQGQKTELNIDIAFSYWGDVQVEVIRQNNDAPSIYLDWQKEKRQEIHHLGILVDDSAKARASLEGQDYEVVYHKIAPGHGEFTYLHSPQSPVLFELVEHEPAEAEAFVRLKAQTENWDGSDPVRNFADLFATA